MSEFSTPGTMLTAIQNMCEGLTAKPPLGLSHLPVAGKAMAIADVLTALQGYAALYQAAEDAGRAREKAVQERDAVAATAQDLYEQMRAALKSALGKRSPDLGVYGISPDQVPAPLTVEQKLARAAKAKATRAARHTMGSRQRAAIKGQVPPGGSPDPQGASLNS